MARVKGGLFTTMLDVNKRFPLDSRMLVAKREDLINPTTWITNTLTTEATYNSMIVSVNSDGEHNGVYYLIDRKAITADNYSAYKTALESGEDVETLIILPQNLLRITEKDLLFLIIGQRQRLQIFHLTRRIPNGKVRAKQHPLHTKRADVRHNLFR